MGKMRVGEDANRSHGAAPRSQSGIRDASQGAKLDKLKKKADKKTFNRMGKAGESDRRIQEKKPNIYSPAKEESEKRTEDKNYMHHKFVILSLPCKNYSCRFKYENYFQKKK